MLKILEKMLNQKKLIIGSLVVIGLALGGYFVFGQSQSNNDQPSEAPTQKVFEVETLKVGTDQSGTLLEKTVILNSDASSVAVAKYSGRIRDVRFEVGDKVYKNQILAVFDQSTMENSARVALDSAQVSFDIANDNLKKTQDLVDETLELAKNARKIAELQLDRAKDEYKADPTEENGDAVDLAKRQLENAKDAEDQAEESVKLQVNGAKLSLNQAKNGLDQAKIGYDATFIKAPISGTIVSRSVEKDGYLTAGSLVAQIVGVGKLQTDVSLSAEQADKVDQSGEFKFEIDGQLYDAELESMAEIANGINQRFELRVRSREDLAQFANKSAKVLVPLKLSGGDNYFIPLSAVNIGQKKTVVFVQNGDVVNLREVQTGQVVGTKIEIVQGLNEGDSIVVENARNLIDGAKVEVKNQ